MTETPLPIRLTQTLGLSTSLTAAGSTLAISYYAIPRLLESPTPLLIRQWVNLYNIGKKTGPPLGLISALSYFYLAYKSHLANNADGKLLGYAAAGALCVGIVPYTMAFMLKTNGKLLRKGEEVKGLKDGDDVVEVGLGEETAHKLVDWWGVLNFGRGLVMLTGGVIGVWTALN